MNEPKDKLDQLLDEQSTHRDGDAYGHENNFETGDGGQIDEAWPDSEESLGKGVAKDFELMQNEGTAVGCIGVVSTRIKSRMRAILLTDNAGFKRRWRVWRSRWRARWQ